MSMAEQITRMQKLFPRFELVINGGWYVAWQGPLRPLGRTHLVRVQYVRSRLVGGLKVVGVAWPQVTLIDPQLVLSTDAAPGESTPHLYWDEESPMRSRLCLFDPAAKEWTSDMAIAETIVPWTIDWLASYEGWLATGEWTGGGRHPEPLK